MREQRWFLPTALTLILALGFGVWGYTQYQARRRLESYLATRYQQAFFDLIDHVETLEVTLGKGLVAGSPRMSVASLGDVWRAAYAAQSELSKLPLATPTLMRTAKFLTQVGDYSFSLARENAAGRPVGEEDRRRLEMLRDQAARLSSELHRVAAAAGDGRLWWPEIQRGASRQVGRDLRSPLADTMARVDEQMAGLPTLIYDGPFSDQVENRRPLGLTGPSITAEQAEAVARRFVPEQYKDYVVRQAGRIQGPLDAYNLTLTPQGRGPRIDLAVSVKGGHVVWMLNNRMVKSSRLSTEEAARRAKEFLESRGLRHMIPTYATRGENQAIIPFAATQGEVILYPDQIKVTVALDNGEILGYDASPYLTAHHTRRLPEPRISLEDARGRVNPDLQLLGVGQLALIPRENRVDEVLTYEFRGMIDGEEYIVYINALTGEEERILRVVRTAEGRTTL